MLEFAKELSSSPYKGEFSSDLAQRITHASDNSIYYKIPAAVLYPRVISDLQLVVQLASKYNLTITPQGGSTATVGQSLTSGLLLDCQRYLNDIIDLDLASGWIEVQAGCSLKKLQNYLSKYGYSFNVEISPDDRCTIAGMVSTNAVGIGGFCSGRMSANVVSVKMVMSDASVFDTQDNTNKWSKAIRQSLPQKACALVHDIQSRLPRSIGGYDLAAYYQNDNLASVFCGSEATLGLISSVKCKISPVHNESLILLHHENILDALKLSASGASAIELLDANLCQELRKHASHLLGPKSENEALIIVQHPEPEAFILGLDHGVWHVMLLEELDAINEVWRVRKSAVATVSKYHRDGRRPLALIEDTAVPPSNLSEYIASLRAILDHHGLSYAMYGHVDAGCVHVRPALNLAKDKSLMIEILHQVKDLCQRFGGVLWGEHGVGYRTQFALDIWGKDIFQTMQALKHVCDPNEIFNPHKMLSKSPVKVIDDWRHINNSPWSACNGQAACLGDSSSVICPSYRASGNKAWSPKARALMMSHWQQAGGCDKNLADSIKSSMDKCLGCHACVSECPVAVNIPKAKAEFLSEYYQSHPRSLRDQVIVKSERYLAWLAQFKYYFCDSGPRSPDICFQADVWTYCFDYGVWSSLKQILRFLQINFAILPPLAVGQAAFSEGDMSEFESLKLALQHSDVFVLEPSYHSFANLVLGQALPECAELLEGLIPELSFSEELVIFGHCTEQVKQLESPWTKLFMGLGAKISEVKPGCCGMAGAFGLKSENKTISKQLFNSWELEFSKAKVFLATGFSCRMQAKKYGYKTYHPVQYLAKKLGEQYE